LHYSHCCWYPVLLFVCIRNWSQSKLIIGSTRRNLADGWAVLAVDVNWEDEHLVCDNCGKPIEAAYEKEACDG